MSILTEVGRAKCGHCKRARTPEGHDGCLGELPGGVMNACCGHGGNAEGAYIQYWDKSRMSGSEAIMVMDQHRDPRLPPLIA